MTNSRMVYSTFVMKRLLIVSVATLLLNSALSSFLLNFTFVTSSIRLERYGRRGHTLNSAISMTAINRNHITILILSKRSLLELCRGPSNEQGLGLVGLLSYTTPKRCLAAVEYLLLSDSRFRTSCGFFSFLALTVTCY